jgi:hypothetical protein
MLHNREPLDDLSEDDAKQANSKLFKQKSAGKTITATKATSRYDNDVTALAQSRASGPMYASPVRSISPIDP